MVLAYRKVSGRGGSLAEHELQVHARDGSLVWHAAQADAALPDNHNLGGTVYDLKGQSGDLCGAEMLAQGICKQGQRIDLTCGGNTKTFGDGASYCTHGVLTSAKGGATVYDDSENTVTEPEESGGWWHSRQDGEKAKQDVYLFLHGTDHKAGLRSLAAVAGRPAVPPRRFFGVWWSRWNKVGEGAPP
jgi:alpha-glucosidase (family GH31 glycosyl hydrolase)